MRDIACFGIPRPPRLIDPAPAEPARCNQSSTFNSFSRLPTELQGEIWAYSLPSRIVQHHLDYRAMDTWGYDDHWDYDPYKNVPKRRGLPAAFFVDRKSRSLCLGQYVLVGNTYVHPSLDILFISWNELKNINISFYRPPSEEDRPLRRLRTLAVELQVPRSYIAPAPGTECGALIKILYYLGNPRNLVLCFKEPNVISEYRTAESPFLHGNLIKMRRWPDDYRTMSGHDNLLVYNSQTEQIIKDEAVRLLRQQVIPGFEFPKIDQIPNIREGIHYHYPRYIEAPYVWTSAVQPSQLSQTSQAAQTAKIVPSPRHSHIRKWFLCLPVSLRRISSGIRGLFRSS